MHVSRLGIEIIGDKKLEERQGMHIYIYTKYNIVDYRLPTSNLATIFFTMNHERVNDIMIHFRA